MSDDEVLVVAEIWRDTAEWGPAFSIITTEACSQVAGVHDRMPVNLQPHTWSDWLDGPSGDARLLCQPYPAEMTIRRTADPWLKRKAG